MHVSERLKRILEKHNDSLEGVHEWAEASEKVMKYRRNAHHKEYLAANGGRIRSKGREKSK